ncbi:MAG: hypothetical protein QM487_15735 [Candidatus Marithrix sp.]
MNKNYKSFIKPEEIKFFKLIYKHKICFKYRFVKLLLIFITIVSSSACKPLSIQNQINQQSNEIAKPKYIQRALLNANQIEKRIWMNEGLGDINNLIVWNQGEDFASLGVGHFIWYPAGKPKIYTETFPKLITFFQSQNIKIPTWLQTELAAPWKSYVEFQSATNNYKMKELHYLLANTFQLQIQFIIQRLEHALTKILQSLSIPAKKNYISSQFNRVAIENNGVYALTDYINFKGEGINPNERYKGYGWGLLQVLDNMKNTSNTMVAFALAANFVLERRIKNSPPAKNEQRWRNGWKKRVNTYIAFPN